MCVPNISPDHVSALTAEDRDAVQAFARNRVRLAINPETRRFWEGIVVACQHPKHDPVPVTGEGQPS